MRRINNLVHFLTFDKLRRSSFATGNFLVTATTPERFGRFAARSSRVSTINQLIMDEQSTEAVQRSSKAAHHDALGDRMKAYERQSASKIDSQQPFLIRLDGHKFSNYTRPFKRPFDDRVANCMEATAMDLLLNFHCMTVFTCSDEITMVFVPPARDDSIAYEAPFGGKVQKLASVTAGFASVCFDRHMREQKFEDTESALLEHVANTRPYFDGRVFNVPSTAEVVNNLVWRSHYDFRRNSVSMLGRVHFSTKNMHKLSTKDLIAKLAAERNVDWHSLPSRYKYGSYIKKERFYKETVVNGKPVQAIRSRPVVISLDIDKYTKEHEALVCGKYLPDPVFDAISTLNAPTESL